MKTSVLPLDAVPRAIVNRETTGVFKLVADAETLKVLGVHIVSENAGDVIYAASLAVKFGLTIEDLTETLAPYLTMAEGLKLVHLRSIKIFRNYLVVQAKGTFYNSLFK